MAVGSIRTGDLRRTKPALMKKFFLLLAVTAVFAACSNEPKGSSDGKTEGADSTATMSTSDLRIQGTAAVVLTKA